MRDYIKKQLESVIFANMSGLDEKTGHCFIPRYSEPVYEIGKCYLIKVAGSVIDNLTTVLAVNWNHSTAPSKQFLKAYVSKAAGKNIYVDTVAYNMEAKTDTTIYWSGWLCVDDLTQVAVL